MSYNVDTKNNFSLLSLESEAEAKPLEKVVKSQNNDQQKDSQAASKPRQQRDDNRGGRGGRGRGANGPRGNGEGRKPRQEGGSELSNSSEFPAARDQRDQRRARGGSDRRDRKPRGDGQGQKTRGRTHDRISGTGRTDTEKKQGAGRRNWGKPTDGAEPAKPDQAESKEGESQSESPEQPKVAEEPKVEDKSLSYAQYQKTLVLLEPPKPNLAPVETTFGANFIQVKKDEPAASTPAASSPSSSSSSSSEKKSKKAFIPKEGLGFHSREERSYNKRDGGRHHDGKDKVRGVRVNDQEFPKL